MSSVAEVSLHFHFCGKVFQYISLFQDEEKDSCGESDNKQDCCSSDVVKGDTTVEVKANSLQPGDIILIKPGEKIASDEVIKDGNSYINESIAAGVLYSWGIILSPAIGAILMTVSTVVVAINASLLRIKQLE